MVANDSEPVRAEPSTGPSRTASSEAAPNDPTVLSSHTDGAGPASGGARRPPAHVVAECEAQARQDRFLLSALRGALIGLVSVAWFRLDKPDVVSEDDGLHTVA
jgi:hypothetical protein